MSLVDLVAERTVLGAILVNNAVLGQAIELLRPDDFMQPNGRVFEAMLSLHEKSVPVDLVTLKGAVSVEPAYLAGLLDGVPQILNVEHWAKIVRDKAQLRRICAAADAAVFSANDGALASDVLDSLNQALTEIQGPTLASGFLDNRILAKQAMREAEMFADAWDGVVGLRTGLVDLDKKLQGIRAGMMVVIAARTGQGKSILGLQIAEEVAGTGKRVAVFSLEMSGVQLMKRRMSAIARVSFNTLHMADSGKRAERFDRLAKAVGQVTKPELMISVQGVTVPRMRAACQRVQREHGLGLVVVDYIQLMDATKKHDKHHLEIKEISGALKRMAVDLDVPVIALSQLNRNPESRVDKKPTGGDIADGDSINRDADVVLLIHREDAKGDSANLDRKGLATIIIDKNRDGWQGVVDVRFNGHLTQFQNLQADPTNTNWDARGAL